MNAHYNRSLLLTLRKPLEESMQQISNQCMQVMSGERHPHAVDMGEAIRQVRSSLEMIGCTALAKIAATVEDVVVGLPEHERSGWTHEEALAHAASAHAVMQGMLRHLMELADGRQDLPVRLWPVWSRMVSKLGREVPGPEDLFEIDPQFSDLKFATLDQDYLRRVVDSALIRTDEILRMLDGATSAEQVEPVLQKAMGLFDWLYGLFHRRGFQGYWLVLRARVALGLLQGTSAWWPKASWVRLFDEALMELHKFREDNLKVQPQRLQEALAPLLQRWPLSWTVAHPALKDFDERFGMAVFWKAVDEVKDVKAQHAQEEFMGQQGKFTPKLMLLRKAWLRHVVEKGPAEEVQGALLAWLEERAWFTPYGLEPLFVALRRIADHLGQQGTLHELPEVAIEVARAVVALEDFIDYPARDDAYVKAQAQSIALRIETALRGQELVDLPAVRWTPTRRRQQRRKVMGIVLTQAQSDLDGLKEAVDELMRFQETETRQRLSEAVQKNRQSVLVLDILGETPASRVLGHIVDWVDRLLRSPFQLPPGVSGDRLADAVTHLEAYLDAIQKEDPDAQRWLRAAHEGVSDTPWATAPSPSPLPDQVAPMSVSLPPSAPASGPVSAEVADDTADWFNSLGDEPEDTTLIHADTSPEAPGGAASGSAQEVPVPEYPALATIFLNEALGVLNGMSTAHDELLRLPHDEESWTILRRGFHTIKGSGGTAGYDLWGKLAGAWEHRVNEAIARQEAYGPAWRDAFDVWMTWFEDHVDALREALAQNRPATWDGEPIRDLLASLNRAVPVEDDNDTAADDTAADDNNGDTALLDDAVAASDVHDEEEDTLSTASAPSVMPDPEVEEAALVELAGYRGSLEDVIEAGGPFGEAHRLVHTIGSLAGMLGQTQLQHRARALELRLEGEELGWGEECRVLLESWETPTSTPSMVGNNEPTPLLADSATSVSAPEDEEDWQEVFASLGALADQIERISGAMERLWQRRNNQA